MFCSVSGFGADSLYAGRPAYDSVIQAMSGLMDVVHADGVPMKTVISTADLLGAEMAVLAVLAALAHRDRTGKGQYVGTILNVFGLSTGWWGEGDDMFFVDGAKKHLPSQSKIILARR